MPGARRGRPEDKVLSGKELWTNDGIYSLIRKIKMDPGMTGEFKDFAIKSVRESAIERGVLPQEKEIKMENAFDVYQDFTTSTAVYPKEAALHYLTLGLIGESGEVAEKILSIVSKTLVGSGDGQAVDGKRQNLFKVKAILEAAVKNGQAAEKLKKAIRSGEKKVTELKELTVDEKDELIKEISDICWYNSQFAKVLDTKLSKVIEVNVEKLSSRKKRGKIQGDGDNR